MEANRLSGVNGMTPAQLTQTCIRIANETLGLEATRFITEKRTGKLVMVLHFDEGVLKAPGSFSTSFDETLI